MGAAVQDVTVDTPASGKRLRSGQLVVWEIQAPSVDRPVCRMTPSLRGVVRLKGQGWGSPTGFPSQGV